MNQENGDERRKLRAALGAFPTGVTITSARAPDGTPVGLTVNSFNALSLDPPLILWALNRSSPTLSVFETASHFAVSILADDQAEVSRRFATAVPDKFAGVQIADIAHGEGGAPVIVGSAAHLVCRRWAHQVAGDHVLFIGEVGIYASSGKKPLIYYRGNYYSAGHWEGAEPSQVMTPLHPR